jgi:hypothetical protein
MEKSKNTVILRSYAVNNIGFVVDDNMNPVSGPT